MSDTSSSTSSSTREGQQQGGTAAAPGQHASTTIPGGSAGTSYAATEAREPEVTGWVGWIMFAATMMLLLGIFHAIAGLVALFQDNYYLVGKNDLVVHVSYTGWGWVHLIGGVIIAAAGAALLSGRMWARIVAVGLAGLSAIVNLAFFSAYPWWSGVMIAFDVLVIWALTVHGSEMKTMHEGGVYRP